MEDLDELFIFICGAVKKQGFESFWKVEKDYDQDMVLVRRNQDHKGVMDMSQAEAKPFIPPAEVKEEIEQEIGGKEIVEVFTERKEFESSQFEWYELKTIADLDEADIYQTDLEIDPYHSDLEIDPDQSDLQQTFIASKDSLEATNEINLRVSVKKSRKKPRKGYRAHQEYLKQMRKKKKERKERAEEKEDPTWNPDKVEAVKVRKVCGGLGYFIESKSSVLEDRSPQNARKPETQWLYRFDAEGKLQCPKCDKKFQSSSNAYSHYRHVHQKNRILCSHCPIRFSEKNSCNLHLEIFHGECKGSFTCELCLKRFSTKKILSYHELHFHESKLVKEVKQCTNCKEEIEGSIPFLQHQFMNHLDCLELCPTCNQPVFSKNELLLHKRNKHKDFSDYKNCRFCDLSFQDEATLSFHEDIVHYDKDLGPRNFVCHCGNFYTSQANLDKHQEVHKSGKKNCQLIPSGVIKNNKVSNSKTMVCHDKLKQSEISEEVIPYEVMPDNMLCKVCGKLIESGQMVTHMKTHKHICQECGRTFNNTHKLKNHILSSHLKIKLHCPVCSKEFNNPNVLKGHISSVHSNQRHKCSFCDKSFKGKHDLKIHIKGAHEGKYASCCICFKKFERTGDKNRHEKSVHNLVKTT